MFFHCLYVQFQFLAEAHARIVLIISARGLVLAVNVPAIASVGCVWKLCLFLAIAVVKVLKTCDQQPLKILSILYLLRGQYNMAMPIALPTASNAVLLMHKSCHHYHVLQLQDYVNDKLNFIGPVRARTGNEILNGLRSLEHRQAQPHLAVHGTSDRCTSLPVQPLSSTCINFLFSAL